MQFNTVELLDVITNPRYGDEGARRHRHAEGVAEELEGLREQLRQLTS